MEGWKKWEGKKVFIILNNNRQYSGEIITVENQGNDLVFINMTDKFGQLITFASGEIKLIQEEK